VPQISRFPTVPRSRTTYLKSDSYRHKRFAFHVCFIATRFYPSSRMLYIIIDLRSSITSWGKTGWSDKGIRKRGSGLKSNALAWLAGGFAPVAIISRLESYRCRESCAAVLLPYVSGSPPKTPVAPLAARPAIAQRTQRCLFWNNRTAAAPPRLAACALFCRAVYGLTFRKGRSGMLRRNNKVEPLAAGLAAKPF
jgi:hypothetical protein